MNRMRACPMAMIAVCGLFGGEFDQIKSSLDRLRRNDPSAAEDIKRQSVPVRLIMQRIDPVDTHWMVKLLAAEWMLRAHLLEARLDPGASSDLVFLNRAWDLAFVASEQSRALTGYAMSANQNIRRSHPDNRGAGARGNDSIHVEEIPSAAQECLTWLCAEIPVRLKDPVKMKLGLETFQVKPSKDPRTQAYAMMAAWHVGNWELATELGKTLETKPKILPALHEQSLLDSLAFDYPSLLQLATRAKPAPFKRELVVRRTVVKAYRFRLTSVEGADPAKVATATADASYAWEVAPQTDTAIQILGAVAHWPIPFGNQLPLSGVMTDDQLLLQGYVDKVPGRFTEVLELKPDATRKTFWVGTLTSRAPDGLAYHYEVEAQLD